MKSRIRFKEISEGNKLIAEYIGLKEGWWIGGEKDEKQFCEINGTQKIFGSKVFYKHDLMFNSDWNWLIPVAKRIIESYFDSRTEIYSALNECDLNKLYKAVIDFINFWNDETQGKRTWKNQPEWAIDFIKKQQKQLLVNH